MFKLKSCEVMQYFEYYDVQEIAVIESRIKSLTWIKQYAIAIHDKDLLENGSLKKKHFHAILTFYNNTTSTVVAKKLHVEEQYVNKIRTTTKSAMLYLVHRNDQDKYQYPPWDIVANFDYVEYVDGCLPKVKKENIAERIKSWEIKKYNLHEYIPINEYAINKMYYERCFEFRQSIIKNMDRKLTCMFITWKSGIWKTTFAKMLAEKMGFHAFVSSGGKNPLDDYKWEECIILDDLRDDVYDFADLLKLSDNNTNSLVGCRFYNKSIAECKLLIITSVQDIHDFYKYEIEEEQKQLFRRFSHYIVMSKETISCYDYNDLFWDYIYLREFENPISKMYDSKYNWNMFYDFLQDSAGLVNAPLDENKL